MKKIRLLVFGAMLTGVSIIASSSMNPRCEGELEFCPIGMTCINGECISDDIGGGDQIPCFSEFTIDTRSSVVDCSTCQRLDGYKARTFATESRCTNNAGGQ